MGRYVSMASCSDTMALKYDRTTPSHLSEGWRCVALLALHGCSHRGGSQCVRVCVCGGGGAGIAGGGVGVTEGFGQGTGDA